MHKTESYLLNLGLDLKGARKRRRWTLALVHQRLECSVQTIQRMEKGDPAVGMGRPFPCVVWSARIQRMEKGDPAVGMGRYLAYIHLLGLSLDELDDSEQIRRETLGQRPPK